MESREPAPGPRRDPSGHILITDVGSTTTKAVLIRRESDGYRIIARRNTPTTVEKPDEDVTIGVRAVIGTIASQTGLPLCDETGRPAIDYLTTSSAGGGLQILVFGLTSHETGMAAEFTAHGAGGVILRTFTIDDPLPPGEQMRLIRELHPDLVVMAGGVEGGDIANIVRLAEILSLADPAPKFSRAGRIPLVFCGNTGARRFLAKTLASRFDLHFTPNIRPTLTELRTAPASEKVLQLFMNTVMERAPGYARLRDWTAREILPTPTGVERILRLYAHRTGRNVVLVDIGGATTDILADIAGSSTRTVAANIGMSYSICNVLAQVGSARIRAHLPSSFSENDVCDYIANKMLYPTYVPGTRSEVRVEQAVAAEGIRVAWRHHCRMVYRTARLGVLDRFKKRGELDMAEEVLSTPDQKSVFQPSDIEVVIGTGGVLSHSANAADAMRMLVDGFLPSGVTRMIVDRQFNSPHLGMLSLIDPDGALDLYTRDCLQDIGVAIAPVGPLPERGPAVEVVDALSGSERTVASGDVLYLPAGGDLRVTARGSARLDRKRQRIELRTTSPVLIDARGRGEYFRDRPLADHELGVTDGGFFATGLRLFSAPPVTGESEFQRTLPYAGEVTVREGDRVDPQTPIARNLATPPRMYIVDVQRLVGYQHELSPEEFASGVLVQPGAKVSLGDRLFKQRGGLTGHTYYHSPVRGMVSVIEPSGLIVLREIQDYAFEPVRIEVARALQVKPSHIRGYLRKNVGDFVQRGEWIATRGSFLRVAAPRSGVLKHVDTRAGVVTLHYDLEPVVVRGFVSGVVSRVHPEFGATIVTRAAIVPGRVGFGGERYGELCLREVADGHACSDVGDARGKIIGSFEPVDLEYLRACADSGIAGMVAPSVENRDWVLFSGAEIGVGSTGDEAIPFTLVLTEGFGRHPMSPACHDVLAAANGRMVSLSGRTQIRAGVVRPMVVIGEQAS